MNRIQTSFHIFKQAMAVLNGHRKLLLFPALSLGVMAVVVGLAVATLSIANPPQIVSGLVEFLKGLSSNLQDGGLRARSALLVVGLPFYVGAMFIATFLNVAFYNEILNALRGKPVSVLGGLGYAVTRSGAGTSLGHDPGPIRARRREHAVIPRQVRAGLWHQAPRVDEFVGCEVMHDGLAARIVTRSAKHGRARHATRSQETPT